MALCAMRLAHPLPDSPLLALVDASAEWHAGTPPACAASVRLLDRVHFAVHRGECVVVQHGDPASARVLLSALSGTAALLNAPGWRGERRAGPQVHVRRCAVRSEVVASVLIGWQAPGVAWAEGQPAVVHLLRASREGYVTPEDRRQWTRWAARERVRGGAIVLVARTGDMGAWLPGRGPHTAQVQEPLVPRPAPIQQAAEHGLGIRTVTLRHGQLADWPVPP